MFRHLYISLLCIAVFTSGPIEARRATAGGGSLSGGGGGSNFGSRGSSGSRTGVQQGGGFNGQQGGFNGGNQGGFHPNQGGGFNQPRPNNNFNNQGGFHPNPNQGGFHPNQGGFNQGGFRPGTGLGSQSSSGTFKKALIGGALGAAGGILAYEAGKAIIKSATEPFNYNGRNYNWDNHGQVKNGEFQCSMPLNQLTQQQSTTTSTTTTTTTGAPDASTTVNPVSTTPTPDQVLQNIQYPDGSRPKTIVWACKQGREVCCGTDCCPAPIQNQNNGGAGGSHGSTGSSAGTIALVVLLILLLLCCGCCIGAYFCCRSIFDCGDDKHDNQQYHGE
ncbi:hypothetical protein GCK72_010919 [Caenorhabditis remanei]|uniref:CX domain-containing protein n=1 Tax=Caenorhabditis remanei TaxID=31234 RepID=A0A6A5H650_CAERE|nr:hypothetical protein GCK72_010919 [Caenorhabditis remanei]KAF1762657.1 hypothetical protein GCK72_010919 [Caenorhabditis remanei]